MSGATTKGGAEGVSDSAKAESLQAKEEGNVRMKAKDWKGAVESYSTAIKLDPANHLFYSNRCVAFLRLEQEDDALKDAQKCLELAPEWPKSYLRMAHVLSTKKQYEEAIDTCNKGLEFEKSNMQLKFMRGEAKKHKFVAKLLGRWHGSVPAELGGYDQELDFKSDKKVVVHVFDKEVETDMRIDAEKDPIHMDLSVPDAGAGAQNINYICKIEDDVLHLCSPTFERPAERPTSFAGPSHVTLKRGSKPAAVDAATKKWLDGLSNEEKQEHYIREALKIFPGKRLLPLATDPEHVQNEISLLNIKFQSENYRITSKYGPDTELVIRDYLLGEKEPSSGELKGLVGQLKEKMQEAMLLPKDEDMAEFRRQQHMEQAAATQVAREAKETEKTAAKATVAREEPAKPPQEDKAEAASSITDTSDSLVTSLIGLSLVLGVVAVAGYFLLKRSD